MYGYDNIANGASISMPAFFLYFGSIGPTGPYLPSIWTSLWTSISALAQAVGAFSVGFVQDRFGRKWTGAFMSALSIAGTGLQYCATTDAQLLGGKIINGFSIGASLAVATTYASEIAPVRLRSFIQQAMVIFAILTMCLGLGVVRAFVPNVAEQAFRNVFAIQWAVGIPATLGAMFIPESPVYLISKGKTAEALKSMRRIYGKNGDAEARYAVLERTIQEEQVNSELETGSYLDCFKRADIHRTLSAVFIYTVQGWGGASFLQQSIYVMIEAGLPAIHAFDVSIGGFGLSVLIIFCSWFGMGLFRRRHALITGIWINLIGMILIGGLFYAPGIGPLWAIAVLMNLLIAIQTSFIQAVGYSIAAEVSSYRLRGKTISLATISQAIVNWAVGFTVPYMYNVGSGNLGPRTGFIFAGFSVVLLVVGHFAVPDTTGMTASEIDDAYAKKIPARNMSKTYFASRSTVA
ncbi:general substrate transporter [Xylariales sp. PMI_506]|nr:general substrate transporter [Xylariales sp. PMI_506]